ncbi:CocE/NonD family hydrolase [Rhodanobacter spathiphylli]|uniref:X-Pro dipeptidyl-peptidase domain-containing protein n=1 Tax=Rhodanobacter spathiphylli B39 TaxID=1163407 RepID=I4W7L1_9GAMM|nr:CocE/NonD family hydrolase [Rhodanobacter spathiphylli]EIL95452.1 X-Pro dipeptidyl-peptidase domain-containing protein [Rhodanobacter spathiphylli B39]
MTSSRFAAGIRPALFALLLTATGLLQATDTAQAKYPNYPSETPAKFVPATASFDYERREVMVPMRDGVRLHTVILVPKGATHAGILLTRTPYDANALTNLSMSGHLGPALQGYDNVADIIVEDGYIRVVQDVRGKYGSEGDYVMNRPLHGPQNPTPVDDATDTYDTIDWLVKNIPESNGKVGTLGISYDGFEPLMALFNPHPALKVSVPMNPMVDGWMGDDWFHNGAFRQQNLAYIYEQVGSRDNSIKWWTNYHDEYDLFMHYGSAGALADAYGMRQLGFWNKLLAHPAYDRFWSDQAVDKLLAAQPLKVPVMLVHSLWDQEDIYGAQAVYRAIKPKDTSGTMVKLVMGPWNHGQEIGEGSSLGAIRFGSDTAKYFREKILRPYLAQYLKDGAPKADTAAVTAYQTGSNQWQRLDRWPLACADGCPTKSRPLYLEPGSKLRFNAPAAGAAYDEYVSDPAHPVPFRARPIQPIGYGTFTWPQWLVDDQREASGRTDVLSYVSDVLTAPLTISGAPEVNLVASTSGTDSDWVVKLIDVYPDQVAYEPEMGGYQLAVAMDIFRGRYREGFTEAKPLAANQPLSYRFALPSANHVFLPGHRIMVQVQSSWFPLYDRNPQTFVPNILLARPADYVKATQRIYHAPAQASFIALPVVGG